MIRLGPICLVLIAVLATAGERASSLYRQARKAHGKLDDANAYLLINRAIALDPANSTYRNFSDAVATRGIGKLNVASAVAAEPDPVELEPLSEAEWKEAREARAPPRLAGRPGRQSFNLRADSKQLFEQVTAAYGLKIVFDGDYQASPPLQFRMRDATWQEAARALEAVTGSFLVAISEQLALVVKDTPQKRSEAEPMMSVVVPLSDPLSPQDVQEAARAVQSVFDMTKMGIDNSRRQVMFRDRVSRLRPALELFRQLTAQRAQVVTEVELLSFNEDASKSYGMSLPTSYALTLLGNPTPFAASISTSGSYATFGGGDTMVGVGITSSALLATMTDSTSKSLMHAELRGLEAQAAQLHVGDRYPVQSNIYSGGSTGSGSAYSPAASVTFEDLGIVLKVTPHVHGMDSVTLEVEAEFKSLTGKASNAIPVISNRKFTARVRLAFGETAIVSGVVQQTLTFGQSGLPGLNFFAPLRQNDRSLLGQRLLLTLRPRLVSLPPSETLTPAVRAGSESRPLTPLD